MQQQENEMMENTFDYFSRIPKDQRIKFYENVIAAKQNQSPPKKVFLKDYPSTGKFKYQDYQLNYYKLERTNQPKAIVIQFHGFRSHGGLTGYYADVISQHNSEVNVYSFDQLNFGRSEGPCKGLVASLEDSVAQGNAFVEYLLSQFESKPKIFLGGSSYGGTIIFKMGIINPEKYSGLILLSPALRDIQHSQYYMKKLGRCLAWIAPHLHLSFGLSSKDITKYNCDDFICKDPDYEKTLVTGSVPAILNAQSEVSQLYGALTVPYLAIQGGMDKSVDLFAPIDLHLESPSKDKQTFYYKNMWHAILYEQEIQDISMKVAAWVKQRI